MLTKHNHEIEKESEPIWSDLAQRLAMPPLDGVSLAQEFWKNLWAKLTVAQKQTLLKLPTPCFKHLEKRLIRENRSRVLSEGLNRIWAFDSELFMESLRLSPHALCRSSEVAGALSLGNWADLEIELRAHRFWQASLHMSEAQFWLAVDILEETGDLPQPILDFWAADKERETLAFEELEPMLTRFLVVKRIESIRFSIYQFQKRAKSGLERRS